MPRVKHGVATRKHVKRVLKKAEGFVGGRRRFYKRAKETLARAMRYNYRDRKVRKRDFRALWITRINIACRQHGIKYSLLINGLKKAKIAVDRKILAELAVSDPKAFAKIVEAAKASIS